MKAVRRLSLIELFNGAFMTMNRRAFLGAAGAGGLMLVGGSHKAWGVQEVPTNLCDPGIAAAAKAAADGIFTFPVLADWKKMQTATAAMETAWRVNGIDTLLAPAYAALTPAMVSIDNLQMGPILAAMQQYQPATTMAQVQSLYASMAQPSPTDIATVIANIQKFGFVYYITQGVGVASAIVTALESSAPPPGTNAALTFQGGSASAIASVMGNPQPSLGSAAMLSQYNCAQDGLAAGFVTIAFVTIGIMTMGGAPVLMGAAWAGIALWGGIGGGAWTIGHLMVCQP